MKGYFHIFSEKKYKSLNRYKYLKRKNLKVVGSKKIPEAHPYMCWSYKKDMYYKSFIFPKMIYLLLKEPSMGFGQIFT